MKVVLRVNIPTMKLKFGEEADLPEPYAKRLLAAGEAITVEDAKALTEAQKVQKAAEAKAEKAQAEVAAARAKAQASVKSAATKAKAEADAKKAKPRGMFGRKSDKGDKADGAGPDETETPAE